MKRLLATLALVAACGTSSNQPPPPKAEPAEKPAPAPIKQVGLAPEVVAERAAVADAAPPPPDLSALELSTPECISKCVRDNQAKAVSAAVIRSDCRASCEKACVDACIQRGQARAQDPKTIEAGCRDSCKIPD